MMKTKSNTPFTQSEYFKTFRIDRQQRSVSYVPAPLCTVEMNILPSENSTSQLSEPAAEAHKT